MVPLPVIVPPVRPFPAVIEVTVPPELDELIVTAPVDPEMLTLVPATIDVTPAFVNVTAPVPPDTLMPVPATAEVTPVFVNVTPPVEPDTLRPVLAAAEVTPVFVTVTDPVEAETLIPLPATKEVTLAAGAELAHVVPLLVNKFPLVPGAIV